MWTVSDCRDAAQLDGGEFVPVCLLHHVASPSLAKNIFPPWCLGGMRVRVSVCDVYLSVCLSVWMCACIMLAFLRASCLC